MSGTPSRSAAPRGRSLIGLSMLSLTLVLGVHGPAAAAIPPNDDRAAATIVSALPYQVTQDTRDATPQANDPECFSDPATVPSVWFSFTPTQGGRYGVSTMGSDYDTVLWVGARTDAGLDEIGCNDDWQGLSSRVSWDAEAGQEYLIMAGSCCGSEGSSLVLSLREASPVSIAVHVAPRGKVNWNGAAIIHGRVSCQGANGRASVDVRGRQFLGQRSITGFAHTRASCGSTWRLAVRNDDFRFAARRIRIVATAGTCNEFDCTSTRTARRVQLR